MNNIVDQSIVVSLAPPNFLQDAEQKEEDTDDMEENEVLATSCANLEPSLHNAPITSSENIGNAHGATLMRGERCLNVLNFSTNHAIVEQLLVEPSLDESLSHDDVLVVPCDKDELFDHVSVLHVLEPTTCAENKYVMHIASANDELKLLSSLHTLGYIEFDDLCNLDCLEERLFQYADFLGLLNTLIMLLANMTTMDNI